MIAPPPLPLDYVAGFQPVHYRTNPRRRTYVNYWRVYGWRAVWWKHLTGKPLPSFGGFPSPSPLRADEVSRQELSPAALQVLDELRRACEPLGFGDPFYHTSKHNLMPCDSAGCTLRQPSGETIARLSYLQSYIRHRPPHHLVTFYSSLADQRPLMTYNCRRIFDYPLGEDRSYRPGLSALALYLEHCRRLEAHRARGNPPAPIRTLEELEAFFWQVDWRSQEFNKARGVYVPMTPAEIEQARAKKAAKQAEWLAGQ